MDETPSTGAEKQKPVHTAGTIGMMQFLGVPVRVHFTFLLLLIFLLFIGIGSRQSGASTALYILALFASVLLHEMGHALVARRYGIRTIEIVMFPIGGVARQERVPKPKEEFWIALAGPFVNLLLAAAISFATDRNFFPLEHLLEPTDANLPQRIAVGNLALALINLAPAFPMDGGRILRAVLALRTTEDEATRIASNSGKIMAILLGLGGLLTSSFMLVFIAMFVYLGASQELTAVRGRVLTSGFPVRAAMITDFRTLQHGATIRDAGDLLLATSQHDFPVMVGGQVAGLLDRAALLRAMMRDGPDSYVAGAMNRDFARLTPDMELSEAMQRLSGPSACALVMEGEQLVGLLTAENVSEFVILQQIARTQAKNRAQEV